MTSILSIETRKKYLYDFKQDFLKEVKTIKDNFSNKPSGMVTVKAYTRLVDETILSIYKTLCSEYFAKNSFTQPSLSIIAIGGYGRGELNINSDIDILFLYEKKADSFVDWLASSMLSFLWDIGMEVGHSCRNINDCLDISRDDIKSFTALIESRPIAGNNQIYFKFHTVLKMHLRKRRVHSFIFQHIDLKNKFVAGNVDKIFLSEPNIKESPGGLRDIHFALWATRTIFAAGSLEELKSKNIINTHEYHALKSAIDLILKIRNALHIYTNGKSDILVHEVQNKISSILDYKSDSVSSGIEVLMRDFYTSAYNLHCLSNILIHRCLEFRKKTKNIFGSFGPKKIGKGLVQYKDEISLKNFKETVFKENPEFLFDIFLIAQRLNLKLSENLKGLIRKNIPIMKDIEWDSSKLRNFFLSLLKTRNASKILRAMHEVGILGMLLPEFGKCKFQIHNDFFHIYTVDEHCLQAVEKIENIHKSGKKELSEASYVQQAISKPEILKLSLLLHDIGKAEGQDHIKTGLVAAENIIKRLDLNENDSVTLKFLIKNHLLMNHVAQRRDLSDKKTIRGVAEIIRDIESLKMLYIHTCADIMAASDAMWTEWKGALLLDLYHKTYDYLMMDDSVDSAEQEIANNCKKEILSRLSNKTDKEFLNNYLNKMPVKYFTSLSPENIAEHAILVKQLDQKIITMDFSRNSKFDFWELTVCTRGNIGTLAKITGILSASSLNILNAQVYSDKDGLAIDILQITPSGYRQNVQEELFVKIEKELKEVLSGKKDISVVLKNKRFLKQSNLKTNKLIRPTVLVNNGISDNFTVFEIIFQDRIGSLYLLTKTFSDLEINIINAKISTQGKRGFDVFYVTSMTGKKILDEKKIALIKSSLTKSLE